MKQDERSVATAPRARTAKKDDTALVRWKAWTNSTKGPTQRQKPSST